MIQPRIIARERRRSLEKQGTEQRAREEARGNLWHYSNSPFYGQFDEENEIAPMEIHFAHLFHNYPGGLRAFMDSILAPLHGKAIGIELGGVGSAVFADLDGYFARSVGVCLTDYRDLLDPAIKPADALRNHKVYPGDMKDDELKARVVDELDGEKFNFVLYRPIAGNHYITEDPFLMAQEISFWYEHTAIGGVFVARTPAPMQRLAEPWVEQVSRTNGGDLEVLYGESTEDVPGLIIRKLSDAPFPLLTDTRFVVAQERKERLRREKLTI